MRSTTRTHDRARRLRRTLTPPEVMLWTRLRTRGEESLRFRRQHPIGPYIADFYCSAARLVVEVDGAHHLEPRVQDHDAARDLYMRKRGYRVLRLRAGAVMSDPDGAAQAICDYALACLRGDLRP